MNIQKMIEFGAREWKSADGKHHRVYFNQTNIKKIFDEIHELEIGRYNTGNISYAYLDGKSISNTNAAKLFDTLGAARMYFDINADEFLIEGNLSNPTVTNLEYEIETKCIEKFIQ